MKVSSSEGGQLYPLLWKELMESRLAIVFGMMWVCSAIAFWLEHLTIAVPSAAHAIINIVGMTAPLVCVLLLSVTRFAIERKRGTWEFLRGLPISPSKIYAAKWIVAVGLGMLFMAGSSGIAWYPIMQMGYKEPSTGLIMWIIFHSAAVGTLIALLLLLDSIDWGEWLGLRAIATAILLLGFMRGMNVVTAELWRPITICLMVSLTCAALVCTFAPKLSGESPLPNWTISRRATARSFSPAGAWIWMQWKQTRFILPVLMLPVPILLLIQVLALQYGGVVTYDSTARTQILNAAAAFAQFSIIFAAVALGLCIPWLSRRDGADVFRQSLPISSKRIYQLSLLFGLALLAIASLPAVGVAAARTAATPGMAVSLCSTYAEQIFKGITVYAIAWLFAALVPSGKGYQDLGLAIVALASSALVIDWDVTSLLAISAAAAAALAVGFGFANTIDRARST